MPNIAIYDVEGAHFNTVKSTFDYYYNGVGAVSRVFYDFGGVGQELPDRLLSEYVEANNIKVVIIPYSSIGIGMFSSIIDSGAICVIPFSGGRFASTVRVSGGVDSNTEMDSSNSIGLDFYSECSNLEGSQRIAPSYVCGKIGAQLANLIDDGYSVWESRQILRQNADAYNNWTRENGFGKVPDAITIPETIEKIHPVDVTIDLPSVSNPNQGLGVLKYRSIDGNFVATGESLNESESPIIIQGENRDYNLDYRNDYGGEYTKLSFHLGEYEFTEAPKKPELFYYRKFQSNKRIHIARTGSSFSTFIDSEAPFDRFEWRVFEGEELIFSDISDYNRATLLLESYNNPDFNLNESGKTYHFQFKFLNVFGESEWSELLEIRDSAEQESQLFDFRSQPDPEPEPLNNPEIISIHREGNQVILVSNNNYTAKVFRKLRINDEWELVATTMDDTVAIEGDSTANYIFAIQFINDESESVLSKPAYVRGQEIKAYSNGIL